MKKTLLALALACTSLTALPALAQDAAAATPSDTGSTGGN